MLYVDHVRIPFGRMLMNHLMANTPEELREAAEQLGLSAYIQSPGTEKEHLDVSEIEAAGGVGHGGQAGHGKGAGQPGPDQKGRHPLVARIIGTLQNHVVRDPPPRQVGMDRP